MRFLVVCGIVLAVGCISFLIAPPRQAAPMIRTANAQEAQLEVLKMIAEELRQLNERWAYRAPQEEK